MRASQLEIIVFLIFGNSTVRKYQRSTINPHIIRRTIATTYKTSPPVLIKSLTDSHIKLYGRNGRLPDSNTLKKSYRKKGRTVWDNMISRMVVNEADPYNREKLTEYYLSHNRMVIEYFRFKRNLLILNLKEENSYEEFCDFLGVNMIYDRFPWENKT